MRGCEQDAQSTCLHSDPQVLSLGLVFAKDVRDALISSVPFARNE